MCSLFSFKCFHNKNSTSRYVDILLGLSLLLSLISLEYGSVTGLRPPLALFLVLSLATLASYWLWFLYLKHLKMESEASKEVTSFSCSI